MKNARQNIRIQQWVAALSVALLIVKLAAYYITNSVAILTDALEGIVNIVAGFLGLYSLMLSAKPRDLDHPYGHGKVEFISAGVEGSMIFIAGILILYKSVKNLVIPTAVTQLDTGIILVAIAGVVNFAAGSLCVYTGKKNNTIALIATGKHLQTDTYTSAGILIGLFLIHITKIIWLDSLVAFLFGGWILYTGYKLVRSSVAGIMDESDVELLNRMVNLLNRNRRENWIDLHNLRFIKYGSILHLDCHLTLPWYLTVYDAQQEVEGLEKLVKKEFGHAIELFVHIDGCKDFSCRICDKENCHARAHPCERKVVWTIENISANKEHRVNS